MNLNIDVKFNIGDRVLVTKPFGHAVYYAKENQIKGTVIGYVIHKTATSTKVYYKVHIDGLGSENKKYPAASLDLIENKKSKEDINYNKFALRLLEDEYIEGVNYYLSNEECLELLKYIQEHFSKTCSITRHENQYSNKTTYDYVLEYSDEIEVKSEFWPCYAR